MRRLEARVEEEKNIFNIPDELRTVYTYTVQILRQEIDPTKTQLIPTDLIKAEEEARVNGNYKPLEDIRPQLIKYSMRM